MLARCLATASMSLLLLSLLACDSGHNGSTRLVEPDHSAPGKPGGPAAQAQVVPGPGQRQPAVHEPTRRSADPIVIPQCRLTVFETQDVPSQRDGVVLKIFVKEGDKVVPGQKLAELDKRLILADVEMKQAKLEAAKADFVASEKTRDEAEKRKETAYKLWKDRVIAPEQYRMEVLTHDRYIQEAVAKAQAITLAERELEQSKVVLSMHDIHATVGGEIKTVFKKIGEAVKSYEPIFQVHGRETVRVEGLVDVQYVDRIRRGMEVIIEPSYLEAPVIAMMGHFQEVNAVAVTKDARHPLVVSASEDGTARVWDITQRMERLVLRHPAAVRAVACAGPGASANLCLTGTADGKARLWNLDDPKAAPIELSGQGPHRGAVTCVAFSADGQFCVTGGEDKEIYLWETATGQPGFKFPTLHRAAITSLHFTPDHHLVSASRDNTLRVWEVRFEEKRAESRLPLPSRSGDVTMLGVSPDGTKTLFDQGKLLRVLALPDGVNEAVLHNLGVAANFTTFALYSPDGRFIVTAGGPDGRLQLWRAPERQVRACELRQFLPPEKAVPTCAAFAPDSSFLVTGTKDRQVYVWSLRGARQDLGRQLKARVTLRGWDVQTTGRQVPVWAELPNPPDRPLLPGLTATMVIYDEPEQMTPKP